MATKLEHLQLEIAHYKNFRTKLSFIRDSEEGGEMSAFEHGCIINGLLQVSSVFEMAIAEVGRLKVVSTDCEDFNDGSDAKMTSVRTNSYGRKYGAPISGIKNKTGSLRVQVYERKLDKFYYFVIPVWKHCSVKYPDIPFELDGTPRRTNHWWEHEVATFEEMALKAT